MCGQMIKERVVSCLSLDSWPVGSCCFQYSVGDCSSQGGIDWFAVLAFMVSVKAMQEVRAADASSCYERSLYGEQPCVVLQSLKFWAHLLLSVFICAPEKEK